MNYCNFINNEWLSPLNPEPIIIKNPADSRKVVYESAFADADLALKAVDAAYSAWEKWKFTEIKERISLMNNFLDLVSANREQLAKIITLENGKLYRESLLEIDASISEGNYQINFLENNLIEKTDNSEIRYEPLGVSLLVTPWNFPVATILRKLIPAALTGNTVVVKASENVPFISAKLFELFEKSGFPAGVVNLINGYGGELVPPIINSNKISAVSFTGSTVNGKRIAKAISDRPIKYQAEMGGNNTVLILNDADLDFTIHSLIPGSFACCGQWCTGAGRIFAESKIYKEALSRLSAEVKLLIPGDGMDDISTIGPLINEQQLKKVEKAVRKAVSEGAVVSSGGKRIRKGAMSNGNFYEPTIITDVSPEMEIFDEEIFGPVITVIEIDNAERGIELINKSKYGLSFSVYGKDERRMEEIVDKIESGLTHINLPTTYREVSLPLLGWKNSGLGTPESGRFARDFFTRTKTIYRQ